MPEPSPRPTRFLRWREPGAGFRECRPMSCGTGLLLNPHEVPHGLDRSADSGLVRPLGGAADLPEAERPQSIALAGVRPVRGLVLRDPERAGHQEVVSDATGSALGLPPPPRTRRP